MADASYSHMFIRALADSLGWNSDALQKALAEIAQLQDRVQELESSARGKAPGRDAAPLGAVTRAKARIFSGDEPTSIAAYAQISGNAVTMCWDNPLGAAFDRAEVSIPAAYKFGTFADYAAYTNFGVKAKASYGADGILTVQMPVIDTAFDNILILMAPIIA